MKRKSVVYAVLACAVFSLTACSKSNPNNSTAMKDAVGGSPAAAKSYALDQDGEFSSQTKRNANSQVINPLTAPANQTYYFTFDSNSVNSSDYQAIEIQANYLASHPNAKVRLEGNTDNRGSREYNIGLGWRRDQAISKMLEQHGVSPKQIDQVSYGKERPAFLGDSERVWRLNRRVNLVYEAY